MASWVCAMSWSAFWIFSSISSPSLTTSLNRVAASSFSFSSLLRLAIWKYKLRLFNHATLVNNRKANQITCSSEVESSLGNESIRTSMSLAQRAINVAKREAWSSCCCWGVRLPARSNPGNVAGGAVCCKIPIALQKLSACWNYTPKCLTINFVVQIIQSV